MREERLEGVWHVQAPESPETPLVFDSPHSGTEFPTEFRPVAPFADVRRPEDSFIDDIHSIAPSKGCVLLRALFPRIYIDPNRSARDLNPEQIEGDWLEPLEPGKKTLLGAGLIWTHAPSGADLYGRKLTVKEIKHRIDTYLHPYQGKLKDELDRVYDKFGGVWHINCHSMPRVTTERAPEGVAGLIRSDFIIGTLDGAAAGDEFTELVRATLAGFGYDVRVNEFFKGVELIRAFSDPSQNRHSLQIEINRGLYMDEETGWRNDNYEALKDHISELVSVLADYAKGQV
jgi:N-formylglutamate deformylase